MFRKRFFRTKENSEKDTDSLSSNEENSPSTETAETESEHQDRKMENNRSVVREEEKESHL